MRTIWTCASLGHHTIQYTNRWLLPLFDLFKMRSTEYVSALLMTCVVGAFGITVWNEQLTLESEKRAQPQGARYTPAADHSDPILSSTYYKTHLYI